VDRRCRSLRKRYQKLKRTLPKLKEKTEAKESLRGIVKVATPVRLFILGGWGGKKVIGENKIQKGGWGSYGELSGGGGTGENAET